MKLKYKHHQHKCKIRKLVSSLSHRNAVEPDSLQICRGCDENAFDETLCVASIKNTSKLISGPVGSAGDFYHIAPVQHCWSNSLRSTAI